MEHSAVITFAPQGALIELSPNFKQTETISMRRHIVGGGHFTFHVSRKQSKNEKRGEIVGFSRRSRSRLNKKMAMLKKHHLPLFVTLTYHEDYPERFEGFKRDLDNFFKRLFRHFPDAGVIWKLEYQERGAPHFHLMLWGVSLDDAMQFIPQAWYEIAGNGSTYHLAWHKGELGNGNENCVQPIRSWNGVVSYAAKYMAKLDNDNRGGRVWGARGKIPYSSLLTFRVNMDVALEFRQSLMLERNYEFQRLGFWTFDFSPDWLSWLDSLIDADIVLKNPPDDPPDWELFVDIENEFLEVSNG